MLIDPRVAEDGVTVADLQEQFEHNMRMREMVTSVNQLVARVRDAQTKMRNASTADNDMAAKVQRARRETFDRTHSLQQAGPAGAHHLSGEHDGECDQKIGRDAIERYAVLKKELDALRAEVDRVLGPATGIANDRLERT